MNIKNKVGNTAFLIAMGPEVHNDVTKALIEAGADPNTKNQQGEPVIITATLANNLSLVQNLIAAKANLNVN